MLISNYVLLTPLFHPHSIDYFSDRLLGILTDTSSAEAKTLNLFGITCKKVIGVSIKNPSGNQIGDTIVGGWGISATPAPDPDASGWGTLTGSDTKSTNAVSIKISGLVTE